MSPAVSSTFFPLFTPPHKTGKSALYHHHNQISLTKLLQTKRLYIIILNFGNTNSADQNNLPQKGPLNSNEDAAVLSDVLTCQSSEPAKKISRVRPPSQTDDHIVADREEAAASDLLLFQPWFLASPSSSLQNLTLSCKENEKKALLKFKENISDHLDSGKLSSWNEGDCCKWSGVSCSTKTGHVIKLNLRNTFSSTFEVNPSLLQLNYLSYLDLSMNNFGGTQIPEFFGSFTRLRYLNLSTSFFGGKIPQNLGNLSGLQYLDLGNYYEESVENGLEWLSGLSSLKYLNLGRVNLYKASSYWLQTINTYLPYLLELHFSHCQLMSIPLSLPFVNFTSLSALELSDNGFNSTIPNWLFNLTNLKTLDLSLNNLHGNLPNEFSELTFLENLDLYLNGIEVPLPKGLGVLCNLQKLSLYRRVY